MALFRTLQSHLPHLSSKARARWQTHRLKLFSFNRPWCSWVSAVTPAWSGIFTLLNYSELWLGPVNNIRPLWLVYCRLPQHPHPPSPSPTPSSTGRWGECWERLSNMAELRSPFTLVHPTTGNRPQTTLRVGFEHALFKHITRNLYGFPVVAPVKTRKACFPFAE